MEISDAGSGFGDFPDELELGCLKKPQGNW